MSFEEIHLEYKTKTHLVRGSIDIGVGNGNKPTVTINNCDGDRHWTLFLGSFGEAKGADVKIASTGGKKSFESDEDDIKAIIQPLLEIMAVSAVTTFPNDNVPMVNILATKRGYPESGSGDRGRGGGGGVGRGGRGTGGRGGYRGRAWGNPWLPQFASAHTQKGGGVLIFQGGFINFRNIRTGGPAFGGVQILRDRTSRFSAILRTFVVRRSKVKINGIARLSIQRFFCSSQKTPTLQGTSTGC